MEEAESDSNSFKLEPEAITPPTYSKAVTTTAINSLYAGGVVPAGTHVTKEEPNTADLHLKSTVWYAENPIRYIRIFDGMQDYRLKEV